MRRIIERVKRGEHFTVLYRSRPAFRIVPLHDASRRERIGAARAEKAREQFFEWTERGFSLTDYTIFVVMKELGLRRVLTTERHFLQAGFEVVPREALRRRDRLLSERMK